ncbi:MAG: hypothetical protein EOO85_28770, partial [Pedobacter sp.]
MPLPAVAVLYTISPVVGVPVSGEKTDVDVRLILGVALKIAACGIILAHNHPSGSV